MQYRTLGCTGLKISEIGMGLEHLLDKDEKTVIKTIRAAVKGGVNYFDCLPLTEYSKETGTNEGYVKLGRAITGLRDQIYLSFIAYVARPPYNYNVDMPLSYIRADFECYLRELNTGYTDVFIVACCDNQVDFEQATGSGSLLEYARGLQSAGRVKHIGFSTHNTVIAHRAIESGFFDVLMYPVNPAFDVIDDEETYNSDILGNIWDRAHDFSAQGKGGTQPRKDVFAACERHGVGLVAMKPFAGGFILGVEKGAGFTPLNLISYALAQSGVSSVVPGCSNPREIKEILKYYSASAKTLDYSAAVAKSRWSVKGNCLYCSHCLPCPAGIDIARVIKCLDSANAAKYASLAVKASACRQCGACMKRCPFEVNVIEKMRQAAEAFIC